MKEKKFRYYVIFFLLIVYLILMFIFFLYPSYKDKHNKTSIIVNKSARWYYADGKWKDMTKTNQYNWQEFDIYQDGSFLGNHYLLYNDRWYIFDKDRNPIKQEGVDIFAIKTNQKYSYGDYLLEDVSEEDEKYIRKVLEDNNINALSFTSENVINFDLDSDGKLEKIIIVSNAFTTEYAKDLFNFIFVVKDDKISIIKKEINTYDKLYSMCKDYVAYLVDLTGKGKYSIITGCGYYSNRKDCIEMYQLKRGKYIKVKSCDKTSE